MHCYSSYDCAGLFVLGALPLYYNKSWVSSHPLARTKTLPLTGGWTCFSQHLHWRTLHCWVEQELDTGTQDLGCSYLCSKEILPSVMRPQCLGLAGCLYFDLPPCTEQVKNRQSCGHSASRIYIASPHIAAESDSIISGKKFCFTCTARYRKLTEKLIVKDSETLQHYRSTSKTKNH